MRLRKYAFAIGGMVTGAVVATGVAVAGTPAADGTISACVNEAGIPRIVDTEAGHACGEGEQSISWSSGWKHRGRFDIKQTYEVGDVVTINNRTCGAEHSGVIARMIGDESLVKVASGADTGCPYVNGLWKVVSSTPQWASRPNWPGTVRIWLTDDNTHNWTSTGVEVQTWNYADGTVWIHFPRQVIDRLGLDARRCTTVATTITWGGAPGGFVTREYTSEYKDWILLSTYGANGQRREMALDVSISC